MYARCSGLNPNPLTGCDSRNIGLATLICFEPALEYRLTVRMRSHGMAPQVGAVPPVSVTFNVSFTNVCVGSIHWDLFPVGKSNEISVPGA
jgi:hypothetical protein